MLNNSFKIRQLMIGSGLTLELLLLQDNDFLWWRGKWGVESEAHK